MRKIIQVLCAIIVLYSGCLLVNNHYIKQAVVVDVDGDVVTIQTDSDYFEFFGDGFKVGDDVTVTFNDNDTIGIKDDFIINCKKSLKKI